MQYDITMMGHISKDIIIDEAGNESKLYGGALLYSSIAAARAGAHVLAITKAAPEDFCALDIAKEHSGIQIIAIQSPKTTSIRNVFLSADHERRETCLLSRAESFSAADIPLNAEMKIIDLAGLFVGELPDNLIEELAPRGAIAVDAQGLLREAQPNGRMLFRDWNNKHRYMPFVSYFKADAAEAKKLPTAEKSPLMKSQTPAITSRAQRNGVARKSKTAPPTALSPASTEMSPGRTCQTA